MSNKKGQGSLVAVILASVIGTIIIGSTTQWFLSMNKTMDGTNDRLEAMTIAMSEWQRLEHMSLDELEANRENYKTPYKVGDNFTVGVNLGEQGFFDNGTCNALVGDYDSESPNCFKDTTMTVYDKDGKAMYTTRSLPLSAGGVAIPEGTIWPYTGDLAKIPKGWVLCDGTNGTPDLTDRFLEGTKTTTGVFKDAGLPNIDGSIYAMTMGSFRGNGAIYMDSLNQDSLPPDNANDFTEMYGLLSFNASRSNPIYGRSDTVQPKSYTVFYIMKTNQDFHYNHTNGIVSPSYYTKEEVDNLLKGERNYTSNNYLNKSSKDYVRNLSPSYTLGLGYGENDEVIHGNVDGKDTWFATKLEVPDYNHVERIAQEEFFQQQRWAKLGNYLSKEDRFWFQDSVDHPAVFNEMLKYVCPDDGFISVSVVFNNRSRYLYNTGSFVVSFNKKHSIGWGFKVSESVYSDSALIPVAKGDIIYYGCSMKSDIIPDAYRLFFVYKRTK